MGRNKRWKLFVEIAIWKISVEIYPLGVDSKLWLLSTIGFPIKISAESCLFIKSNIES